MAGPLDVLFEALPLLAGSKHALVKVSFGKGNWAEVPNVAILDARETERPSAGVYVVHLVRTDAAGVVLSLNQGSADLMFEARGRAYSILRTRAAQVRAALDTGALAAAGFTGDALELGSTAPLPRAYAAGSIVAKAYGEIPDATAIERDLAAVHAAYLAVNPSRRLERREGGRVGALARGMR